MRMVESVQHFINIEKWSASVSMGVVLAHMRIFSNAVDGEQRTSWAMFRTDGVPNEQRRKAFGSHGQSGA